MHNLTHNESPNIIRLGICQVFFIFTIDPRLFVSGSCCFAQLCWARLDPTGAVIPGPKSAEELLRRPMLLAESRVQEGDPTESNSIKASVWRVSSTHTPLANSSQKGKTKASPAGM